MKRFAICLKWEKKTVFFEDLEWFALKGYGLSRQRVIGE